jgi:putative ABC transport system permease protein
MSRPPWLTQSLLARVLPRPVRDAVLGDLAEEYAGARRRAGRVGAGLWYLRQALSLAGHYGWEALRRPAPPAARPETGDGSMQRLFQDLRHAGRTLVKRPGFSAVAMLTLALGIGANTAIFSVLNAVLLRPLPCREPQRLVQLWESNAAKGWNQNVVAAANYFDWRDRNQVFESIAAYEGANNKGAGVTNVSLTGLGEAQRIQALGVTGGFFDVLGVPARLGRTLRPEDDLPEAPRVVVVSHGLWQSRFGGDPDVIGRSFVLNGVERTVIGVMPPSFRFPDERIELWVPFRFDVEKVRQAEGMRRAHWMWALARLKPGVTHEQARDELQRIAQQLEREYPGTNEGMGAGLTPLQEWVVGDVRPSLLVLFGAVGLVLLIACANVANLLLVRTAGRKREMAIHSALGAGRKRLIAQMLAESLLLAACGGALGLLLGRLGVDLLIGLGPADLPRLTEVGIDGTVLAFTSGATLLTGLAFGLLPALAGSRPDVTAGLKAGGREPFSGLRRGRGRGALVVAELGLSLVLVLGAGLLLKSLYRLNRVEPGFDREGVLTMEVTLPERKYPEDAQVAAFYSQFLERLEALPGARAAGAVSLLPIRGTNWTSDYTIEGPPPGVYGVEVRHKVITPRFLQAMGLALRAGRAFTDADGPDAPPVILINEALARREFPGRDPIGQRLKYGRPDLKGPFRTIVGVVADAKQDGLDAEIRPEVYEPHKQGPWSEMTVVLRTDADPRSLAGPVRSTLREMDPDVLLHNLQTMDEVLRTSLARERFMTLLLSAFAALALALAAVGVYGVIAYTVSQSTQEIGIRMALGAGRHDILRLVVGQGMALLAAGVALGLGGAFALSRHLESLLFEVSATDPALFAVLPLILAAVALVACYVPARRAMQVDPVVALHDE